MVGLFCRCEEVVVVLLVWWVWGSGLWLVGVVVCCFCRHEVGMVGVE